MKHAEVNVNSLGHVWWVERNQLMTGLLQTLACHPNRTAHSGCRRNESVVVIETDPQFPFCCKKLFVPWNWRQFRIVLIQVALIEQQFCYEVDGVDISRKKTVDGVN